MSIVTAQGHLACAEDDGEATSDEPAGQHESTPAASPNDDTSPRSIRTFSQGEGSLTRTREGWQQVFMHDTEVGPVMAVRHATDPSHLVNESTNPMSWDRAEAEAFADAAAPAATTTALVVSSSPVAPQTPITPARVVASVQQERLGTYEEDDDEDPRFNGQGKGSFIRAEYPWLTRAMRSSPSPSS